MLTKKEIREINEFITNSSNPVYLYDNDPDGVCAYLVLKKYYKKGAGLPIKSYPSLNAASIEYIERHYPDLLIILDKAEVEQNFFDKSPCAVLWLDHHPLKQRSKVHYYNPLKHNKKDNRPTTYLVYSVAKSNLWLAMLGCISDYYLPNFTDKFIKEFPGLITEKNIDKIIYNSEFGKLVKIISFNLKGKKELVKKSLECLEKIESPYEILNSLTKEGKFLFDRSQYLSKEYNTLLNQAKEKLTKEKILLFIYPEQETSFTADLAGELKYLYPDKIVIVGREKENYITMSLRTAKINIERILGKALIGIEGYGGGHKFACGASVKKEDFERFIENIKQEIKKR